MRHVIRQSTVLFKDPKTGKYRLPINSVTEQTTAEQIQAIQEKGEETLRQIPESYTEVVEGVNSLKDKFIVVSEDEPTEPETKVWVDPGTEEIELLTPEDLEPLQQDLRASEVGRVVSLSDAVSLSDGVVFETIGCPEYIDTAKRQQYARYNIAEDGWYVFARVFARSGDSVSAGFSVTGAAGYIAPKNGDTYVDVAIKFNVIAETQRIVVNWGKRTESFIFKATDLATRNLDYRVTFYLYDIKDYATYEFGLATDEKFVKDKHYYTKQGDNYVEAEVTVDDAIPADTYYVHKKIIIAGYTRNVSYYCDLIDCPIELHLPTIYDDNYGAWFEIQFKADASYSVTIIPEGEAKVSGTGVNTPKVGINIINMQYHKPTQTWLPTVTNWAVSATQPA